MRKLVLNAAALGLLVAAGTAAAQSDSLEAGKQVYEAHCVKCHDSGKMGAPVLSDPSEWTELTRVPWSEVHALHLEDGMLTDAADDPAKGITAEQMEAATNYILSIVTKK
jgi:cytochrome c5